MAEPPTVPPSGKESCGYYIGLSDCPTLVGRSITHAAVPLWNDSAGPLRRKILEAVKGVDWNAIDIFRCGSTSLGHCHLVRPVIPFVSVEPGSITWMSGRAVALKYRDVLREHGIHDVEVEIKESRITQCCSSDQDQTESDRSTAKLEPRIPTHEEESFGRHNIQLSEFLGTKIASSQFPTRESTKGLYLRVRNTETVVALTCRHVVFGQEEENVDFCRDTNNTRSVLQPGNKTYQDTMGNLHEAISWINSSLRCYKSPTEKQLEHEMHFEGQAREKPTAI
ncbi:hypothetical protein FOPG_10180 [Fusarium oxysporum f. sp. conglutinans race 2 54008]|uniref:Uncharacterized protein n=1 Tax=Fusarium oxysporum f. sp. conglutinans race 2 54008 TaxID=1089457 RepID=X0INT0_FUSOX|nr:hypothetical protein FOPG_10180 [Fusarium oxysporum f. sp. conglutinans race 2 54008]KAG6996712.1 hypothetical protein FocnCong_v015954 [Fusarium oxysporum f. sp. conglutinans]